MFDNYVYFTEMRVQNYSARKAQLNVLMLIRMRRSSPCGVTCNLLKKNKYKILYRLIDDIYFNTGFKQVKNSYNEHKYKQAVISITKGK